MEPLNARSRRIQEIRRLSRRRERTDRRQFLAEGAKSLTEALLVPGCVVEVLATAAASREHDELRTAVRAEGAAWTEVTDAALAAVAGSVTPQGLVAVCGFVDVPLEAVLPQLGPSATLAVCADVRDPGNAGTIIRTADAAGADAVVLAGSSVDAYNDKTVRATVGSLFHLPIVLAPDVLETVAALRDAGVRVLAADGAGEHDLFTTHDSGLLDGRVAWLLGNEAWGLPDAVAAAADHRVAIPIPGRAESLNLATAAALCLYESARHR